MNFNEKLIDLRKTKGMSQEELGAELKVSRQTIQNGNPEFHIIKDTTPIPR